MSETPADVIRCRSSFPLKDKDLELIVEIKGIQALAKSVRKLAANKNGHHVGIKLAFGVGYHLLLYCPDNEGLLIDLPEMEMRGDSSARLRVGDTCEFVMPTKHLYEITKLLRKNAKTDKTAKYIGMKLTDEGCFIATYANTVEPAVPLLPSPGTMH